MSQITNNDLPPAGTGSVLNTSSPDGVNKQTISDDTQAGAESTANATMNFFAEALEGTATLFSNSWNATTTAISNGLSYVGQKAGEAKDAALAGASNTKEALSYEGLAERGQNINDWVSGTTSNAWTSFTDSSAVTWVRNAADGTYNGVVNNTPEAKNWLPVAVATASAFTTVKAFQAAQTNYNAGNLKRAAAQVFVGTAGALLTGSLVLNSPLGKGTTGYVGSFFGSSN